MSTFKYDESRFPLVIAEYPATYTAAELGAHLEDMKRLLMRGKRYVALQDMTAGMHQDAASRDLGVKFMKDNFEATHKLCVCSVFVVSNNIIKLALQGVFALQKPPFPYVIVSNRAEGEKVAQEKLRESGLANAGLAGMPAR